MALAGVATLGTTAVVAAVWLPLRRPLHTVLRELCAQEHRASFWVRLCGVELAAGVALAGCLGLVTATGRDLDGATVATTLRWDLAGGIAGVLVIALVVLAETARFQRLGPPGR